MSNFALWVIMPNREDGARCMYFGFPVTLSFQLASQESCRWHNDITSHYHIMRCDTVINIAELLPKRASDSTRSVDHCALYKFLLWRECYTQLSVLLAIPTLIHKLLLWRECYLQKLQWWQVLWQWKLVNVQHLPISFPLFFSLDLQCLPYILAYKSLSRISRPPKKRVPVWSKIIDPRISRRWFLGTCTESSRYTHNAF